MIAIIDYDAGNIKSVVKAMEYLSIDYVFTRSKEEILKADKLILPGVGSFGSAMERLNDMGLTEIIRSSVSEGKPFLGICLGLQLLFEDSEESPGVKGLSVLKGHIRKIPVGEYKKIPHMGWNSLSLKGDGRLFKGIKGDPFVYFVHSFYLDADDKDIVKATTQYNVNIDASVEQGNVFACQFHPEKSSDTGLKMLRNFAEL
ncbi:MAG: imidazole glycerol phosphate synthase subunit HisH [Lachnospiraceae bacterium]|nr:imidazole glycerol phosphate synthase subunit HisH [Lachnospiraceae bacterium]